MQCMSVRWNALLYLPGIGQELADIKGSVDNGGGDGTSISDDPTVFVAAVVHRIEVCGSGAGIQCRPSGPIVLRDQKGSVIPGYPGHSGWAHPKLHGIEIDRRESGYWSQCPGASTIHAFQKGAVVPRGEAQVIGGSIGAREIALAANRR